MITGNISDCEKYYPVNKYFKEAFEALKELENGVENTELTIKTSEPEITDTYSDGRKKAFEAHRKYIDLHYIIKGFEEFGYANINTLETETEYDENRDCMFLRGKENRILLSEGDFAITFPEDAHIPSMYHENGGKVLRAVVKIPAED